MTFHIGQEVVCINDRWGFPGTHPNKDYVYKILSIEPPYPGDKADAYLRFAGCDYAYDRRHFRPVMKRKTDISIFTAMLTPNKAKVDA